MYTEEPGWTYIIIGVVMMIAIIFTLVLCITAVDYYKICADFGYEFEVIDQIGYCRRIVDGSVDRVLVAEFEGLLKLK